MPNDRERARVILAIGNLQARGLLEPEDDPEFTSVRVGGHGFRYLPRFWTLTGVLEVDGPNWRLCLLDDGDAARARHRVAAEWITAGAPSEWARMEATAVVMMWQALRDERVARV